MSEAPGARGGPDVEQDRSGDEQDGPSDEQNGPGRGPNLTLIYSLIVLAMLAAIAIAALVVLPFYHRR